MAPSTWRIDTVAMLTAPLNLILGLRQVSHILAVWEILFMETGLKLPKIQKVTDKILWRGTQLCTFGKHHQMCSSGFRPGRLFPGLPGWS